MLMDASTICRSVRAIRGSTQSDLARLSGVPQPSIAAIESRRRDATVGKLNQILDSAKCRLVAVPTTRPTIAEWAEALRLAIAEDKGAARKVLVRANDSIRGADPAEKVVLCSTPPAPTADRAWDAVLAGLVDFLLSTDKLPVPSWVNDEWRTFDGSWDLIDNPKIQGIAREETPRQFSRRGVFVPGSFLESV